MDEAFGILLLIGIGAAVFFGPWFLLWRSHSKRVNQRLEDQSRWADLTHRIHLIEQALKAGAAPTTVNEAEEKSSPALLPDRVETIPILQEAPQVFETPARVMAPPPPPILGREPTTPPIFATETPATEAPRERRFKSALDVEERLGTNWLNKLGIGLLVLGLAFLISYQLKNLGPAGKVLMGYALGGAMLGLGIWFERKERYRILGRAGVGGGWALLFFTTYAMYFVPAAHVIESQLLDLVLLLVVASAMVLHTLRYRSQVVTGLAFFLAFLTVSVSHSTVYGLGAGAVLATGLVIVVGRLQWFELEIFGMLASYLNHYLWLRPLIEPMKEHRHNFAEFPASAAILALYWAIFRVSYVWRHPKSKYQERISSAAALLNTALMLLLFKYQSTNPHLAFWALLGIGGIETLIGQLKITRRRRMAAVVLSTIGVLLLIAAFPFRYSGSQLSVLWLLEAEALLLIGVWTQEVVFRRMGTLVALLVAGQMVSFDAARVYGMRMDDTDVSPQWKAALLFLIAAGVFYANAHWIFQRWSDLFVREVDRQVMQRLSYLGALMAAVAVWLAFPEAWTAAGWCGLGLALVLLGHKLSASELKYQGNFLAIAAIFRALSINLASTASFHGMSQRTITISLVAALLYLTSRWSGYEFEIETTFERSIPWFFSKGIYTWAASLLLGLLAWYELREIGVAVAWAVGGLILLEIGLSRKSLSLRLQAYAALLAAFARIFFVNLNGSGAPGEISPRFYTVVPIACTFFHAYWQLDGRRDSLSQFESRSKLVDVCNWWGTIAIAALVRFELEADWVATGWAALAFALTAVAWRLKRRAFLYQSLLLAITVLFRTSMHNFYERSYFPAPSWETRWITVGTALFFLLASQVFLFKLRNKEAGRLGVGPVRWMSLLISRPEQLFFFVLLTLLTTLLAIEMRHGMVTLSWGVEALVVFMFALVVGERSFRLAGLGLLLLCAAKILVIDVWRLNPSDRYITLIVLGAALLSVSFLYTRYRDAIRQYL
jgi:uncharacterized membrane protein